jgi:hypothetical protein
VHANFKVFQSLFFSDRLAADTEDQHPKVWFCLKCFGRLIAKDVSRRFSELAHGSRRLVMLARLRFLESMIATKGFPADGDMTAPYNTQLRSLPCFPGV